MSRHGAVVDGLRVRGVIGADAPDLQHDEVSRPWFVSLMLGAAGWLAGFFIMLFIGIAARPSSSTGFMTLGLVLGGGAWALYNADREGAFLDQLALALSIAGQVSVGWGLFGDADSGLVVSAVLLLLQLVVFALMPNRAARVIAALFASVAWVFTVRFLLRPDSGGDFFLDNGHGTARIGAGSIPAAWLLTWAPLVSLVVWLIRHESRWMASPLRALARPALTGLLLAIALGGMATEPFVVLAIGTDYLGMQFSFWALFPLLSVMLAIFAAWGAFRLRSRGLLACAAFGALLHLGRLYYLYGSSLLLKSAMMLFVGMLLLGLGVLLQRRAPAREGA